MHITYQRFGGYEVSTRGDKRFSALVARLPDGRTIEEAYQLDVKGYRRISNNWRAGKGKPPLRELSPEQQWLEYLALWREWATANVPLMRALYRAAVAHQGILSDRFATTPISQARALAVILNDWCPRQHDT